MITGITIHNLRCIKHVGNRFPLEAFHVLVGPNGSGKSTFLDAIELVKDCLTSTVGPRAAVEARVPAFRDLTWMRKGGYIAVRLCLHLARDLGEAAGTFEYVLKLWDDEELGVAVEDTLVALEGEAGHPYTVAGKRRKMRHFFVQSGGKMKRETFSFNRGMPALALVPPDEKLYPAANAVRRVLTEGLRFMQLNSRAMRQPCPATRPTDLELDGSNLARVVGRLLGKNGSARERTEAEANTMQRWVEHLRYALPDLDSIGWGRREPDNAEYITLKCKDGLVCPSWLVSDGTLRMLALTLLAFLPPAPGIYLIEEPENGVHPKALELIMRSLSSVPSAQVFVATHSPLVVQLAGRDSLLCFQKDEEGTHITHGADHPRLREWDGVPDLATVFACGILE